MNSKVIKPIIWLMLFILAVGLGCNILAGAAATPTVAPPTDVPPTDPPPTPVPSPTEEPPTPTPIPTREPVTLPTNPPATESPPVETQAIIIEEEDPPAFYIEEFEGNLSNYSYFVFLGVDRGSDMVHADSGQLEFELEARDTWVYFTYDPWSYENVRIGMSVENRGVNSQRVSLTCMVSEDGWFEFNIGGDGLYEILVYDAFDDRFVLVGNGGSTAINLGRATNEYIAECIDDTLSLYINGQFVKSVPVPNDFLFLSEGLVGFAVSSFDVVPVRINIDWFGIEAP